MAESTLSVDYDAIRREAGRMLGYGRTPASQWDSDQSQDVEDCIKAGLRMFYYPPPVDGRTTAHEWGFLRPIATLTLSAPYSTGTVAIASGVVTLTGGAWPSWAAQGELTLSSGSSSGTCYSVASRDSGTQLTLDDTTLAVSSGATYSLRRPAYTLPDNFCGLDGKITYRANSAGWAPEIRIVSDTQVRLMRQRAGTSSGRPVCAAIRVQEHSATAGTRYEAVFFPSPDAAHVLEYPAKIIPSHIDATNKYPIGGAAHSETIIAAVLAACEQRLNGGRPGSWYETFIERLKASIAHDQAAHVPPNLGYNGDGTLEENLSRLARNGITTYNGVEYGT